MLISLKNWKEQMANVEIETSTEFSDTSRVVNCNQADMQVTIGVDGKSNHLYPIPGANNMRARYSAPLDNDKLERQIEAVNRELMSDQNNLSSRSYTEDDIPRLEPLLCIRCNMMATLRCSRCKVSLYCSMDCHITHWRNVHHRQCKAQCGGSGVPDSIITNDNNQQISQHNHRYADNLSNSSADKTNITVNNISKKKNINHRFNDNINQLRKPEENIDGGNTAEEVSKQRKTKNFIPRNSGFSSANTKISNNHKSITESCGKTKLSPRKEDNHSSMNESRATASHVQKVEKPKDDCVTANKSVAHQHETKKCQVDVPLKLVPKDALVNVLNVADTLLLEVKSNNEGELLCLILTESHADQYRMLCSDYPEAVDKSNIILKRDNVKPGDIVSIKQADAWWRAKVLADNTMTAALIDDAKIIKYNECDVSTIPDAYMQIPEFSARITDVAGVVEVGDIFNTVVTERIERDIINVELSNVKTDMKTMATLSRWFPDIITKKKLTTTTMAHSRVKRPKVTNGVYTLVEHNKDGELFVCSADDCIKRQRHTTLHDVLLYGNKAAQLSQPPAVGSIVISEYMGDYFRAIVKRTNKSKNKYLVEYHEYGNQETTQLCKLRECPDELAKRPVHVARVKLDGVKCPYNDQVDAYLCKIKDTEEKLKLTVIMEDSVRLVCEDSNVCLNNVVGKMLEPQWKETLDNNKDNLIKLPPVMFEHLNTVKVSTSGGVLFILDTSLLCQGILSCCSQDAPIQDTFNILPDELKEYCDNVIVNEQYAPRPNELCIARCPPFDQWFRAICIDVCNEKRQFPLLYVDYGNINYVSHTEIRRAVKQLFVRPALSSMCTINGYPEKPSKKLVTETLSILGITEDTPNALLHYTRAEVTDDAAYTIYVPKLIEQLKQKDLL